MNKFFCTRIYLYMREEIGVAREQASQKRHAPYDSLARSRTVTNKLPRFTSISLLYAIYIYIYIHTLNYLASKESELDASWEPKEQWKPSSRIQPRHEPTNYSHIDRSSSSRHIHTHKLTYSICMYISYLHLYFICITHGIINNSVWQLIQ